MTFFSQRDEPAEDRYRQRGGDERQMAMRQSGVPTHAMAILIRADERGGAGDQGNGIAEGDPIRPVAAPPAASPGRR